MEKTASKNDNNYTQVAFALEILRLLAEKPRRRDELGALLTDFLEQRGKSADDILQKLSRTIAKLRDCGFEIRSAPNRPYELVESSFPLILAEEQRQALAMAAYVLTDMGFSTQAGHLLRLGKIAQVVPTEVKVNFSPPVDYSEERLDEIVQKLQDRFRQQQRYSIRYRTSRGSEQNWDLDRSELRLHNGVLYLFAFVPDFTPRYIFDRRPNAEQNLMFRVDRITQVRTASPQPWSLFNFPKEEICYRMSGALGSYKPRRDHEREARRDRKANIVEIVTHEDYLFGFRQRILQYGSNAQVLSPTWLAQDIKNELQRGYLNYASTTKE